MKIFLEVDDYPGYFNLIVKNYKDILASKIFLKKTKLEELKAQIKEWWKPFNSFSYFLDETTLIINNEDYFNLLSFKEDNVFKKWLKIHNHLYLESLVLPEQILVWGFRKTKIFRTINAYYKRGILINRFKNRFKNWIEICKNKPGSTNLAFLKIKNCLCLVGINYEMNFHLFDKNEGFKKIPKLLNSNSIKIWWAKDNEINELKNFSKTLTFPIQFCNEKNEDV